MTKNLPKLEDLTMANGWGTPHYLPDFNCNVYENNRNEKRLYVFDRGEEGKHIIEYFWDFCKKKDLSKNFPRTIDELTKVGYVPQKGATLKRVTYKNDGGHILYVHVIADGDPVITENSKIEESELINNLGLD